MCGPQQSQVEDNKVLELYYKTGIPPGLEEVTG